MSETSKKNSQHHHKHHKHYRTAHPHHHPTPTSTSSAIAASSNSSSHVFNHPAFVPIANPHATPPISRSLPSSVPATTAAASITPSVPMMLDSTAETKTRDHLVGTMLGTLGGLTVLLMAVIFFASLRRSRRACQRDREQQSGGGPGGSGKRGWGVRESWYSDTLSTCPSTLPPPYDVGYDDDKKEQPTAGGQMLQPPSPTACTKAAGMQYTPQLAYSPTSYSAFDMNKHDLEKQQHLPPLAAAVPRSPPSAVAPANVRNSLQYAPQLAFSPSFHTSNLISGIDMTQASSPLPTASRSTPANESTGGGDAAAQQPPPSPTATKSTPHYLPRLAFSPSLHTADMIEQAQASLNAAPPSALPSAQQHSTPSVPVTTGVIANNNDNQTQGRHLLSHMSGPQQPAASSRSSWTSAAPSPTSASHPDIVPRPSRSTVRSYQAQLNMDL